MAWTSSLLIREYTVHSLNDWHVVGLLADVPLVRFAAIGDHIMRGRQVIKKLGLLIIALTTLVLIVPTTSTRAISPGPDAFQRTWQRTDGPVASHAISRTWMWGPAAFTAPMTETMTDAPDGRRVVQYFDKSRMEITNDPTVDPDSIWYVTNGLLATELVTGRLQLGLDSFEERSPAAINVAGDPGDPNTPTYATFTELLDGAPIEVDTVLTRRVARDGQVSDDPTLASYDVQATYFVPETNHTVAGPFWEFMNSSGLIGEGGALVEGSLFPNPFYATGFPITEAYWTTVQVGGQPQDVLVQVFERRVLTYTPGNDPGWRVEAGNVGQHYFTWRYGMDAPTEPPAVEQATDPLGASPMPTFGERGGQAALVVANAGPTPLTVTLDGPMSRTVEIPACDGCSATPTPPSVCPTGAPQTTIDLPPGNYRIVVTRPGNDPPPLAGPWTLLPNARYGACFFVTQ